MPAMVFLVSLLVVFVYGGNSVWAANPQGVRIIRGSCGDKSHIAEGSNSEDLTRHQRPVSCNFVVISNTGGDHRHMMVQFGQSASHSQSILGFAGYLLDDGVIMVLSRVYLTCGQETPVTEGACKFFFANQIITSIACGANIVSGVHKVVPIVLFEAAPN